MFARTFRSAVPAILSVLLTGCAGYVDDFTGRVSNGDDAYNRSIAQSVLANVIRAGYGEPTSYVGLGKYTGTNNTTLNGAFPGFTLSKDPLQIAVSGFSGKEDTNAQIETTVLNTRKFVRGMSTNIDLSMLKDFIDQGYSRELLLYLFVEQFRVTNANTGEVSIFRNDPNLDIESGCERIDYTDYANRTFVDKNVPPKFGPSSTKSGCEYHKFQYWVEEAMKYGYNVDFPPGQTPNSASTQSSPGSPNKPKTDTAAKTAEKPKQADPTKAADQPPPPAGRFCYDLGLMSANTSRHLLSDPVNKTFAKSQTAESPICGSKPIGATSKPVPLPFEEGGIKYPAYVVPEFRSPAAVFRYVGRLAVTKTFNDTELFEHGPLSPTDRRIIVVDEGHTAGCYSVQFHFGTAFCIPMQAYNTKIVISILAALVQLNTDRDDLPTNTTTVNISP